MVGTRLQKGNIGAFYEQEALFISTHLDGDIFSF